MQTLLYSPWQTLECFFTLDQTRKKTCVQWDSSLLFLVYLFPGSNFFIYIPPFYDVYLLLVAKKNIDHFFLPSSAQLFYLFWGIFLGGSNFLITYPQCYDNQSFCFWNHSICFANHISEFPETAQMLKKIRTIILVFIQSFDEKNATVRNAYRSP